VITVLVVDDHELVRTGICRMLEDHPMLKSLDKLNLAKKQLHRSSTTPSSGITRCQYARHWWR
jgi:DNA-binding NarL/FixJ family response regulator